MKSNRKIMKASQAMALQKVVPNPVLKSYEQQARGLGLTQTAVVAEMQKKGIYLTRVRFNMAINGKADLSEAEFAALLEILSKAASERVDNFKEYISSI